MKIIKKNRVNHAIFDDFFTKNLWAERQTNFSNKPQVNIIENDNVFKIELIAPGLSKDAIKVALEDEILTISYRHKEVSEEKMESYTQKEYIYSSFKRSFNTPNSLIDGNSINGAYENGVLKLTLPKAEAAKPKPAKEIAIA